MHLRTSGAANAPRRCRDKTRATFSPLALSKFALLIIGVLAAHGSSAAEAQTVTFVTSTGEKLTLLSLDEVDTCEEVEQMLRKIDRSQYRVGSPSKMKDPRDRALFKYEDEVARRIDRLCPHQRSLTDRLRIRKR